MNITVKLFATLRENREKERVIELKEGTSIQSVIEQMELPVNDIAIMMVNGRGQKQDTVLKDGDVVSLFPPVGGG